MPESFNSNFEPVIVNKELICRFRTVPNPCLILFSAACQIILIRLASLPSHFKKTGKQLRGRMALTAADCFGSQAVSLRWAAAVEILHNASLVHDDICDGDMVRRGAFCMGTIWQGYSPCPW